MFLAAIGTVRTHVQTPFDGFSSGSSMLAAVLIIAWRQLINSNGRIRILSTDYHMSKKSGHFVPPFFLKGIPQKLWHWTQQTPRKIPSPDLHFIIHGRSPVDTSCIRLVVYQFLLNVMHMALSNKMMGKNSQTTFFWFTKIAILFRKKNIIFIFLIPLKSWEPTIMFMLCSPFFIAMPCAQGTLPRMNGCRPLRPRGAELCWHGTTPPKQWGESPSKNGGNFKAIELETLMWKTMGILPSSLDHFFCLFSYPGSQMTLIFLGMAVIISFWIHHFSGAFCSSWKKHQKMVVLHRKHDWLVVLIHPKNMLIISSNHPNWWSTHGSMLTPLRRRH